MKHLFVPYELALLAKEKGFEQFNCFANFYDGVLIFPLNGSVRYTESVSAPLYQQLVDWFREKHNLIIEVSEWDKKFTGKVKPSGKSVKIQINNCEYYEALTAALTESFNLI